MVEQRFDVCVVGSGSAGCILASRLAESGATSVVLLEAGPDLRADPPAAMHDGWATYREHGWGYESEPTPGHDPEPLHRGKLVGGTSWVTRFAFRGSPDDFEEWVRLGNAGWGFDDVLPYFIRLENDLDFGAEPWHGNTGRLPITRHAEVEPGAYEAAVSEALAAAGVGLVADHNRPGAVGAGRLPRNAVGGRRVTAADVYLPVGAAPGSLTVRANSVVAHVVVEDGVAVGVRLLDGTTVQAGWVVLCAGTYGSPALLLRSGIGPADEPRALGIDVNADLPGVGQNLADHPGVDLELGVAADGRSQQGIYSLATAHSSMAGPTEAPDIALWSFEPWGFPAEAGITAMVLTPRSRGTVRLRSADPTAPPRIVLPGLEHPDDVTRMAQAYDLAWEVAVHPSVRRQCPSPVSERVDAGRVAELLARESWSFPHTVGTCAMGPEPVAGAVVDPWARVHGIERLSVVDASIIPTAPAGFPHLITMMLAERIAEQLTTLL